MASTVLQLRIGATRDKGFLFRTCARPPLTLTVGRSSRALLPVPDPLAPGEHPLFTLGQASCLIDFMPGWPLILYRDEQPVTAAQLVAEGLVTRAGRRALLQLAPGARGTLQLGSVRLLWKWEALQDEPVGDVPLRDLGEVPRCFSCGLALRDALPRDGLYARCDACRALNRFVDPEARFRERPKAAPPGTDAKGEALPLISQKVPIIEENARTILSVPIFAPVTGKALPLLQDAVPAGQSGPDTPVDIRRAGDPFRVAANMQTVLERTPLVRRDRSPFPSGRDHQIPLDDAFFQAEFEAIVPTAAPQEVPARGDGLDPAVPWATMSVLSARSEWQQRAGRVDREVVLSAVADSKAETVLPPLFPMVALSAGVCLLLAGLYVVFAEPRDPDPERSAPAEPGPPPPAASSPRPARLAHPPGTYVKLLPDDPTPISVWVDGFAIDADEVTADAFARFVAATGRPAPAPATPGTLPATGISFDDARAYCRWADGRLPTESEWERAGAGAYGRSFPWGNSFQPERVALGGVLEPVGSHPSGSSESGVRDLIGNAPEWVEPPTGQPPFLKGGGVRPWDAREGLQLFARIDPASADWAPGPGFRCAEDRR